MKELNTDLKKEKVIRSLGVFELRALAREVGVSSPTTKKREELIDLILENMNKTEVSDPTNKRKGRPFKKLASLEDIVSTMTIDDDKSLVFKEENESILTFAQDIPDFSKMFECEEFVFSGIARKYRDGFCFCDEATGKMVFLTEVLSYFGLVQVGDNLTVKAKGVSTEKNFEATEIVKINGVMANLYRVNDLSLANEIILKDKIPFAGKELVLGRRNALVVNENFCDNNILEELIENCSNSNEKVVLLGTNISFEDNIVFKNLSVFKKFLTVYGESAQKSFNAITDAINFTQRQILLGQNVVLVVCDIIDILRTLNKALEKCEEAKGQALVIARKLLSIARAYDNGLHSSELICYMKQDENNEFVLEELLKISKKCE